MLRYIYFAYVTMTRLTAIAAILLCLQRSNAQLNTQINNANIRHDSLLDGLYGNMGTMNVVENSNQIKAANSNPQTTPLFQSLSKNGQFSLTPHHFSIQTSNLPQSLNLPVTSAQISGLEPLSQPPSALTSSNFRPLNLGDILNPKIDQDQNLISNIQFSPQQLNPLTPTSLYSKLSDLAPEQIQTADIGCDSNIPASVIMSQSIPYISNPPATSSFSLPIPLQFGNWLQKHQPSMSVSRNVIESPNTLPGYVISVESPLSTYIEKPKPSIWKELLPLILNVLKENRENCGCCRCKYCCKGENGKVNEPQVYGGYSKEKRYGHPGEENNEFDDDSLTIRRACENGDDAHDEEIEEVEDDSEET